MQEQKNCITLEISDVVVEGRGLWSFCEEFNGLLYTDLESGQTKILAEFPQMPFFIRHAFVSIVKVDDILVFAPKMADSLYAYQMSKNKLQSYALPEEMVHLKGRSKFDQTVVFKKNVFMLGYSEPCIVCFDVSEGKMTYYKEWYQDYLKKGFEHEILLFEKEMCVIQNRIFFPPRNGDCIIEFDMETRQCIFHDFIYKKDQYYVLCYEDGFFWTYGAKNRVIVKMDDKFAVVDEFSLDEMEPDIKKSPVIEKYIRFSHKKGNLIWLFSGSYEKYVQVDIEKRSLMIGSFDPKEDTWAVTFPDIKNKRNKIYVFEPVGKKLYVCDDDMEKVKVHRVMVEQEEIFEHLCTNIETDIFCEGEQYANIEYLCWYLRNNMGERDRTQNMLDSGSRIFNACKEYGG